MADWSDILHTLLETDYLSKFNSLVTRAQGTQTTVDTLLPVASAAVAAAEASAAAAAADRLLADADKASAALSAASSAAAWSAALASTPDLNPAFRMNPSVVSADITVPSDYCAFSAGPLTIGEGVSVTLNDFSEWTIL